MNYERKPIAIKEWSMYEVDTNGVVYSKKGQPLKYSINHSGYCIVNFYDHNTRKGFAVHTLVAETFIPNPENKPTVNHIDGNKENNSVKNLEWATYKEQIDHAHHILGYDNSGGNNANAKAVQGFNKKTNELEYEFDSLANAAKYFTKPNHNYRYIENILWHIVNNTGVKKSYKNCIWKYK